MRTRTEPWSVLSSDWDRDAPVAGVEEAVGDGTRRVVFSISIAFLAWMQCWLGVKTEARVAESDGTDSLLSQKREEMGSGFVSI